MVVDSVACQTHHIVREFPSTTSPSMRNGVIREFKSPIAHLGKQTESLGSVGRGSAQETVREVPNPGVPLRHCLVANRYNLATKDVVAAFPIPPYRQRVESRWSSGCDASLTRRSTQVQILLDSLGRIGYTALYKSKVARLSGQPHSSGMSPVVSEKANYAGQPIWKRYGSTTEPCRGTWNQKTAMPT